MKIGLYASMNNGDVFNKDIPYIAVDGGLEYLRRVGNLEDIIELSEFEVK